MKKSICLILAALLLLSGCQPVAQSVETTGAPVETEMTLPNQPQNPVIQPTQPVQSLAFSNPGKVRLTYTGNRSYVKYVTSADQLPGEEALAGYDGTFFENHALLVLVETVNSSSVRLEIGSIQLSGDTATVRLNRTMSGAFGTSDMATWLLWAEVEKDLDCNWTLEGGSRLPKE